MSVRIFEIGHRVSDNDISGDFTCNNLLNKRSCTTFPKE